MKKLCILAFLLILCITATACGTPRPTPPDTPLDDALQESDVPPTEEDPVRKVKDGFNAETNSEFEIGGINFSIPSYYLGNKMSTSDTSTSFYAETTDTALAQLYFLVESLPATVNSKVTTKYFYQVVDSQTVKLLAEYTGEQLDSEEVTIAGLPGKVVSFHGILPDTDDEAITYPSLFKYAYIYDSDSATVITIELRQTDSTEFDYSSDFDKIIETAEKSGHPKDADTPDGIDPAFKEAMDSYEAFFDEYIAFMVKYQNSDNPASMMLDYLNFMTQYTEATEKMEEIDEDALSPAESAYYTEVMARVSQKMINASIS